MKKGADSDMIVTSGYRQFIGDLKARVTAARLSTARHINRDLINLYWDIGQSIDQKQAVMGWGESVVEVIARDLSAAFPGTTGLSPQNVWRMLRLYRTYTDAQFISQLVREANRQCLDARGPVGWELSSLKRVSEIQGGLTLGKVYEGRVVEKPYLRVANVQDGHLSLTHVTTIAVPEEVRLG